MTTKAKEKWRPKNCQSKYATYYDIASPRLEKPTVVSPVVESEIVTEELPTDKQWCSGCLSTAVDPMEFPCGHHFCRSCIAHSRAYLIQEYKEQVKDTRTVLKCPVPECYSTLLCFSIINGDIRFWKQHPRYTVLTKSL
ncbi:unnamed protein product [Candidula unifasciata]|uniref:RING-type domain-containing protein n=1 Tax=Candidula unifasciata TaxID=100452 RepID=A0A8S3ZNS8_9EUPU|nr:unnamed protein product [Candidula unifasciata]